MSDTQTELLNTQSLATNSSTHVSSDNLETGTQICTSTAKNVDSSEFIMQVKVRAMQVMVEFQLSSRQLDASEEKEMFSGFEGELVSEEKVVCVADEGMVIVWDHLDLAYPNVTSGESLPSPSLPPSNSPTPLSLYPSLCLPSHLLLLPPSLSPSFPFSLPPSLHSLHSLHSFRSLPPSLSN